MACNYLFVTTFCINVTHTVLTYTSELSMVKAQGLVNLIQFPASCLYECCGQQARPRLAWPCLKNDIWRFHLISFFLVKQTYFLDVLGNEYYIDNLCAIIIRLDALDFNMCRYEEVISFF